MTSITTEQNRAVWRPMIEDDLDAVAAIARIGFPDHFEGRECFTNRLTIFPSGCFVLARDATVFGYLITYPWRDEDAPALNVLIYGIPPDASVMYLHDLALHPDARGKGHSREIVDRITADAIATGWPAITLVAVNDAAAFWARLGFIDRDIIHLRTKLLSSYGPNARYMTRKLQ